MTSKKCWVVNVKNRRPGDLLTPKNPLSPDKGECDAIRPMGVAKVGGENGGAADMSSLNQLYVSQLAQQVMQHAGAITFDPTGAHLGQQYMAAVAAAAHLNGSRPPPFLPFPPGGGAAAGHMIPAPHHMIPGLPTSAYPMPVMLSPSKPQKAAPVIAATEKPPSGKDTSKSTLSPPQVPPSTSTPPSRGKSPLKTDENQNSQAVPDSHEVSPEQSNENQKKEGDEDRENTTKTGDEDDERKEEPAKNLNAVKKILDKINEQVEMQKNVQEDKAQISKLMSPEGSTAGTDVSNEDSESPREGKGDHDVSMPCRHCKEVFHSPVELHQHERYLCRSNREIQLRDNVPADPLSKLLPSPTPGAVANPGKKQGGGSVAGSVTSEGESEGDTSRDDMFVDKDGHQYRVRSMLSDDQQKILKSYYSKNPRPDKFELMQIATEVGFPKRVVQVWFQNMRARDRRRGLPVPTHRGPAMIQSEKPLAPVAPAAGVKHEAPSPVSKPTVASTTPTYIPVVPHIPFTGVPATNTPSPTNQSLVYYANKANGQIASPAVR